jgi:hypothetical protein
MLIAHLERKRYSELSLTQHRHAPKLITEFECFKFISLMMNYINKLSRH